MDQYIHGEVFVPTAVVISTESARELVLSRTGLSIPQLLSPFGGYYTPLTCQYRVLDRSFRTNGFKIQFVDSGSATDLSLSAEAEGMSRFLSVPAGPSEYHRESAIRRWFSGLSTALSFSPHDCLSQPVASLLVVALSDANPMDTLEQLSHVSLQPDLCRSGVLDSTSARVKVVVFEESRIEEAEALANVLRGVYHPHSVVLLPLPVGVEETSGEEVGSIFEKHGGAGGGGKVVGLEFRHVDQINRAVEQIVQLNAIPWMERKLVLLDQNITAKRKGLRNQFRNFLKSATAEPAPGSAQVAPQLQQVEWQCRLAGDLAFHLRAYDAAYGYYRNVCADFKQDKSMLLAAAGCYEMSGLVGMLGATASTPELSRFLDTAIELYRDSARLHAVRAAMLQSFLLRGRVEGAEKLIKANGEIVGSNTPASVLRSAILLDQAAALHAAAGMSRKEGFTRVLAGHMYNKVDHGCRQWALLSYSAIMDRYRHGQWVFIKDHLLFTMAKLEFGMGHLDEAMKMLVELLTDVIAGERSGTEKHSNYLKLLAYIAKGFENKGDSGDEAGVVMPVPVMKVAEIDETSVSIDVCNPLSVPVEVSQVHVDIPQAECEVSGLIQLGPNETRRVSLLLMNHSCEGAENPELGVCVKWTLFGSLKCSSKFSNMSM